MKISFHGGARSVTGSRHVVHIGKSRILLDCGMFQGRRQQAEQLNRHLGFEPRSIQATLLSHGHIDHSGALPILAKEKFKGSVYMTPATADLTTVLLEDSARIQRADSSYLNKRTRKSQKRRSLPYYDATHVGTITEQFQHAHYRQDIRISSTVKGKFFDAGHILGSSAIWLQHRRQGNSTSIVFSGDLGRSNMPILRDPQPPPSCDILIIESTYGDRTHKDNLEAMLTKAEELVAFAVDHKSKIIVPAFAVGRTQHIVMRIKELVNAGRISPIPIFIDSPLAYKTTKIFRRHPECFDRETFDTFTSKGDPFAAKYIRYVSTAKESKALNRKKGPCIIISASGMCEGGRVLHHLKHSIQDEANVVALVGFQAEHTLGRKLIEEWDTVPIFGIPTPRRARIVRFNGLSAHADREDLLAYVRSFPSIPRKVFVVHGEERQSFSLAQAIRTEHPGIDVSVPESGSIHNI